MRRYLHTPDGANEIRQLSQLYPSLETTVAQDGSALTQGLLSVGEVQYTLVIHIPDNYPLKAPFVECNPREIPWVADRHIFVKGRACLCARIEIRKHWPRGATLVDFMKSLVIPFFVCQNYYEAFGYWPPGLGRPHNAPGILEAVGDVLVPLGSLDLNGIIAALVLLSRKSHPGGHEMCPCGSGLILRKCHSQQLRDIREMVDPEDAEQDMLIILRSAASSRANREYATGVDQVRIS